MSLLVKSVRDVVSALGRLPGIGPKSAIRLAFYLLNTPDSFVEELARSLVAIKKETKICRQCFSVSDEDMCSLCQDEKRNERQILVVESTMDVLAIEKVGSYNGLYHVLGGVINPLEHIGPDDIKIVELIDRLKLLVEENKDKIELVLATSLTMEGEATALYIKNRIDRSGALRDLVSISRIGSGLPMGADLGYADEATLSRALSGRRKL
ncbi:recombination protein RecR [Candidatus Shapirobacteria bacterium]|nr:MAG: recombination protein RecR [Candidatus Shapirobacteria bacterium]